MGNVIQIKRGEGPPPNGVLAPYELCYDTLNGALYIGGANGEVLNLSLEGGGAIAQPVLPKTSLLKSTESSTKNQILQVRCDNLSPQQPYTLCLYTMQKSRGNASRYWRHPAHILDPEDGDEFNSYNPGEYSGFRSLAGEEVVPDSGVNFPAVPDWMGHAGVLVTEWELPPVETGKTHLCFKINLNEWIEDLLKPLDPPDNTSWGLIGLANNRQHNTSRYFQFRIRTSSGAVGTTENTLVISHVSKFPKDPVDSDTEIGFFSIR